LLRHPRIVARITQLQGEMAQAHCRNLDILLGKLETIYRRAVDDHHFAAATRAVELQAKLPASVPFRRPRPARGSPEKSSLPLPAAMRSLRRRSPLPTPPSNPRRKLLPRAISKHFASAHR
jgi:hypothetical protein